MGKKSDSSGSKDIGSNPVMPEVLAAFIKENCKDLPVESQEAVAQLVAKKGVPGDKKLKFIMDEFVPKLPSVLQRFILIRKTEIFSSITAVEAAEEKGRKRAQAEVAKLWKASGASETPESKWFGNLAS